MNTSKRESSFFYRPRAYCTFLHGLKYPSNGNDSNWTTQCPTLSIIVCVRQRLPDASSTQNLPRCNLDFHRTNTCMCTLTTHVADNSLGRRLSCARFTMSHPVGTCNCSDLHKIHRICILIRDEGYCLLQKYEVESTCAPEQTRARHGQITSATSPTPGKMSMFHPSVSKRPRTRLGPRSSDSLMGNCYAKSRSC